MSTAPSPQAVVKENLGTWLALAEAQGVAIPRDFVFPEALATLFANEYDAYSKKLAAVEAIRLPIVDSLRAFKERNGQFEEFDKPSADGTESSRALSMRIRDARRPTRKDQTVIESWSGNKFRVFRVDAQEDKALVGAYHVLNVAKRDFVERVAIHLVPVLLQNGAGNGAKEQR